MNLKGENILIGIKVVESTSNEWKNVINNSGQIQSNRITRYTFFYADIFWNWQLSIPLRFLHLFLNYERKNKYWEDVKMIKNL